MNKEPLVTIITPSYNQGQFIEETINSVLNQTYKNIEYIVMDAKSTDNTIEILEKYKDRLKYISEKDKGQSDAINKGFKMAQGEYVGWINSDDVLTTDCVEKIVNEFKKNEKLGIVYGDYINIDKDSKEIRVVKIPNLSLNTLLNTNPRVCQPGSFYRTKCVREIGYLDESLHYAMDYDLWIRLLKISEIEYLPTVLAKFRIHENSKTISQVKNFFPEVYKISKRNGGSMISLSSFKNLFKQYLFYAFRKKSK